MASNYLLMILVLVPAWQPQSPIKHLLKLEAGLLNWKETDSKQVAFSAKRDLSAKPCLNPLLSPFPPPPGFSLHVPYCHRHSPRAEQVVDGCSAPWGNLVLP